MAFPSRKSATGSFSSSAAMAEVNCDPSLTFDLEDFLMNEAVGGSEIPTFVNIHAPIKEEPEAENEDSHEYVHSPMGLPIPQRNFSESRFSSTSSSLTDGLISSSPSLWAGALRPGGVANFPTTPFNTPIQGTFYHQTDLKGFFTPSSRNPTLPVTIKEEVLDLDADLQTMKAVSMFPMEEDDIFQVDKADLIQGPTLAELNANDESLLSDVNFDDFLLPASSRQMADSAESGLALSSQGDRFRMTELNAAFASSPSFSGFELAKTKNNSFTEEELSQLSSSHIGLEFDQSPEAGFVTTNPSNVSMDITDMSNLLSASLPASLSRVSRVSREEPKVKPPPPYPGTRPKIVPELLPLQTKDTASSSHSPSPTRPPMVGGSSAQWGGARQRTTSSMGIMSPGSSLQQRQADCKSPGLAASNPLLLARLSSSAPAPSLLAGDPSLWQRREPRPRLLSTSSLIGEVHGGSTSSISTAGILSPGSFDFSHDEGFDSEEDSDHYEDFDDSDSDVGGSDDESREPRPGSSAGGSTSGKKERYFWQYNVQAKGPKGQKLCVTSTAVDPHVLAEAQDPVFSAYCSVDGIKHSGKARRGDGNDLTPNPRKLHSIGRELDKLNRLINDMTPVSELPVAVRSKSRKEKNKLASRACRLKKKAQHEANKVKLFGLEQEHKKLMSTIHQVKLLLASKCESLTSSQSNQQHQQEITQRIDRVIKPITKIKIAGHTAEFVNKVLERVKNGEPAGGLDEF